VTEEELLEIQKWAEKDRPCSCGSYGYCERHGTYQPYAEELLPILFPAKKSFGFACIRKKGG
jgi:hypothetical protein